MAHGGHPAPAERLADASASRDAHVAAYGAADDAVRSRTRTGWDAWGDVVLVAVASRVVVWLVGWGTELAQRLTHADRRTWRPFAFAETYPHYHDVAVHGYTSSNAVNFPLLPAIMSGAHAVGIPYWLSAFVVSNVAFVAGLVGMAMLGARFVGDRASRRAAIYLAIAPFAYWFSVTSTESLLLVLVVGAALLAMRATPAAWLGAGVLAALATVTRPPGALVGLLLACLAIDQMRHGSLSRRGVAAAAAAGAMIPAALAAFCLYLNVRVGDPLAWLHAQDQYNRHTTLDGPVRAIGSALRMVIESHSIGQAIELAATFGAAAMLVMFAARAAGRRWEIRGWVVFGAASLLMPLATGVMWQMPRFALLVPPVFWMLGSLGERTWLHRAVLVLFPLALIVKTVTAVAGVHA